jgi:adenine-specific DNA glycosylase
MNPSKVVPSNIQVLTDLPNVGPSIADDLRLIGINKPHDLVGENPLALYNRLCEATGTRHDPCVLDVFMSVTDYMAGNVAQPWWAYTKKRKEILAAFKTE